MLNLASSWWNSPRTRSFDHSWPSSRFLPRLFHRKRSKLAPTERAVLKNRRELTRSRLRKPWIARRFCKECSDYETHKADRIPPWWFFFRSQPGWQDIPLSAQAEHLHARRACLSAVTAILGVGDFFGEICLAGYPRRMSTAVALTASSIRTIQKKEMMQMLRKKNKASNAMLAYLLSSGQKYKDHVAELITCSSDQRLARVLLRLASLDQRGPAVVEIPTLSHQVLAEMVGTTRQRINLFMNRFRKRGFISYNNGQTEVYKSLKKVLRPH